MLLLISLVDFRLFYCQCSLPEWESFFQLVGTWFVRIKMKMIMYRMPLNMGNWSSIVLYSIASYFAVTYLLPEKLVIRGFEFTPDLNVYLAILVGLVVGALMSIITEYYTAIGKRPVLSIVKQSSTGHATNIIGGLAVGMESTAVPMIVLAGGIFLPYSLAGFIWRSHSSSRYDGYHSYAVGY